MRILHTSDWHLGKMLDTVNRLNEQKQFVDELCDIVEAQCIDLVLIAGDIFDNYTPSSAAEELFYEAVDRLSGKGKRAVLIIAGNHDSPDRLCAASPLAYKNGIIMLGYPGSDAGNHIACGHVSIVNSGAGWLELKVDSCEHNAVILTLPYPSESRLDQVLSAAADEAALQQAYSEKIGSILGDLSRNFREDTVNLVVGHLFLKEGRTSDSERQLGGALMVDPAVLPQNAHFVALGHLHRPQKVPGALVPTYYSGSPLAYSFSETGYSKLVYVVEVIPGTETVVTPVYLNAGKPLVQWIAKNGLEEALEWCEEGRDRNAWIDLEVHMDRVLLLEEQKRIRELNPGILNIRPVIRSGAVLEESYVNRENKKMDELFKDYFTYKTGLEAALEVMDTFLEIINEQGRTESIELLEGGEGNEAQVS